MAGRLKRRRVIVGKKKGPNRAPHVNFNHRIDPQIHAAFEAWRNSREIPPPSASALEHALTEYLRSKGFDPANYMPTETEEDDET